MQIAEQEVHPEGDLIAIEIDPDRTGKDGTMMRIKIVGVIPEAVVPVLQAKAQNVIDGEFAAAAGRPTALDAVILGRVAVKGVSDEVDSLNRLPIDNREEIGRGRVDRPNSHVLPHSAAGGVKQQSIPRAAGPTTTN